MKLQIGEKEPKDNQLQNLGLDTLHLTPKTLFPIRCVSNQECPSCGIAN